LESSLGCLEGLKLRYIAVINLKKIIDEGWETALILEGNSTFLPPAELNQDDTDWNIDIKAQLSLMSDALREYLNGRDNVTATSPYGIGWDYFSFGHCLEGSTHTPFVVANKVRIVSTERKNST